MSQTNEPKPTVLPALPFVDFNPAMQKALTDMSAFNAGIEMKSSLHFVRTRPNGELRRWKSKESRGRHSPRGGKKPRPAGPIATWHDLGDGMGWGTLGIGYRMYRLARRTVGLRKQQKHKRLRARSASRLLPPDTP